MCCDINGVWSEELEKCTAKVIIKFIRCLQSKFLDQKYIFEVSDKNCDCEIQKLTFGCA
jgi:hypothetical protein